MPLPIATGNLVPEADLRSVVIRRKDRRGATEEANSAESSSNVAEGLFFTKGLASAQAFRPSYWSYGDVANDASVAADGGDRSRPSAEPQEQSREDDELACQERAFLAAHLQVVMRAPSLEPVAAMTEPPEPPPPPAGFDHRAPEADLSTIRIGKSKREATIIDGLFARKSGANDAQPEPAIPDVPDVSPGADAPPPASAADVTPRLDEAVRTRRAVSRRRGGRAMRRVGITQVAILMFGSVALFVSLWFFLLNSATRPRDIVAVQLPQAAVPAIHSPTAPPAPSAAGQDFLARGDASLRTGDVFSARLFYQRAAELGIPHGALMEGATYDPGFLAGIGVHGLQGDVKAAREWYVRASALGDPEAARLLQALPHQ